MNKIFKQLKKQSLITERILLAVSIMLTLLLIIAEYYGMGYFRLLEYLLPHENIFSVPLEELKEGEIYDISNDIIYDWYANDRKGYYGITDIKDVSGNNKLIGYYVLKKDYDKACRIIDNTWNMVEGKEADGEIITRKGTVCVMGSLLQEYFSDYLKESGVRTSSYRMYMIKPVNVFQILSFWEWIMLITGPLLLVAMIIIRCANLPRKDFKEFLKQYHISESELVQEWENRKQISAAFFMTDKYLIYLGRRACVVPYDELIWVYGKVSLMTERRGKTFWCPVSEGDAKKVIDAVSERCPEIYVGYNGALYDMYLDNFSYMVEEVRNRREQNNA